MTVRADTRRLAQAVADAAGRRSAVVVLTHRLGTTDLLSQGRTAHTGGHPVTDRTRFEIGSVTKTFTALLLAELAARGVLDLDEPLAAHVPAAALPSGPGGARITARHLATHTAGLPRLPPGILRTALTTWTTNPYQHFTPDMLLPALARTRLRHPPGTRTHYSNFGFGLLGHLLEQATGRPYAGLLRAHVLEPLQMTDTSAPLHPTGTADDPSAATGYRRGRPRPPWLIPGLPAAGAIRTSAQDLMRYLCGHIDPGAVTGHEHLSLALRSVLRPGPPQPGTPLAWFRRHDGDHEVYLHAGATRGFTTFTAFCQHPATAVVALTNTTATLRNRFVQNAYVLLRHLLDTSETH